MDFLSVFYSQKIFMNWTRLDLCSKVEVIEELFFIMHTHTAGKRYCERLENSKKKTCRAVINCHSCSFTQHLGWIMQKAALTVKVKRRLSKKMHSNEVCTFPCTTFFERECIELAWPKSRNSLAANTRRSRYSRSICATLSKYSNIFSTSLIDKTFVQTSFRYSLHFEQI